MTATIGARPHAAQVTVSVVSHRQNGLVNALLADLQRVCAAPISLVVTENVPDSVAVACGTLEATVLRNDRAKGFGANHNAAFAMCRTPYFCVVNPDIRLSADPLPPLLDALRRPGAGVAAPLVRSPLGAIEDSARRFPTLLSLARKALRQPQGPDYPTDRGTLEVDWCAGMFLLFRSEAYRAVGGFDEAYFLYYEDADICRRLRRSGWATCYAPAAGVTHDARRASRREPRLALHHLRSAARFLFS